MPITDEFINIFVTIIFSKFQIIFLMGWRRTQAEVISQAFYVGLASMRRQRAELIGGKLCFFYRQGEDIFVRNGHPEHLRLTPEGRLFSPSGYHGLLLTSEADLPEHTRRRILSGNYL